MPAAARHRIGGRYELIRQIGAGGMASVWAAHDVRLQRHVAVKLLHPHLHTREMIARFREEGQATAQIRHPNVVAVFDTVVAEDCEAIVLELVRGPTLRQVLDRRQMLPIDRAVSIAIALTEALDAAHSHGVFHRDIKPANIILGPSGTAKLTDFGIAKRASSLDLTRTGTVLGTARYVAPEQLRGQRIDARSDIYSLAIVLYEMICGTTPFAGDTDDAIALARLHTNPMSPRQQRPDVQPRLEQTILRALHPDPQHRYSSARDFGNALRAAAGSGEPTALLEPAPADAGAPPRIIGRLVIATVIAVSLVLAVALIGSTETGTLLLTKLGLA